MKKKYEPWYRVSGLKPITGFIAPADKQRLKKLAEAADKSLTRYVSRILERHVREMEKSCEKLST